METYANRIEDHNLKTKEKKNIKTQKFITYFYCYSKFVLRKINYVSKNIELGKSTFFSYGRKNDKSPTIKFADLIHLTQMKGDTMESLNSIENNLI